MGINELDGTVCQIINKEAISLDNATIVFKHW